MKGQGLFQGKQVFFFLYVCVLEKGWLAFERDEELCTRLVFFFFFLSYFEV